MAPRPCDRPHLDDPTKVVVDAQLWAATQAQALSASQVAQAAQEKALVALSTVAEQVATAVQREREAAAALRSNDVTSLVDANKLLREQLLEATKHHETRDQRILDLQAQVSRLQAETAQLQGARADVSLAMAREEKELRIRVAEEETKRANYAEAMRRLDPFAPLLSVAAVKLGGPAFGSIFDGIGAPKPKPAPKPDGDGASASSETEQEQEVIDTLPFSHVQVREWKKAVADVWMALSDEHAAMYRLWVSQFADLSNPDSLPSILKPIITDAGPERVRRLHDLTAAARPN